VCAVRIHDVGEGLPCVDGAYYESEDRLEYAKSTEQRPFNDVATVDVGRICPVNYPEKGVDSHKFQATMYYELPPQSTIVAGERLPQSK